MTPEEREQFIMMDRAIDANAIAVDPNAILQTTKRFLRDFTFGAEHTDHDNGMLGIFMLKSEGLDEQKRISISNWSQEFVTERAKINGYTHDPSVIMVQQAAVPFTWEQGYDGADRASLQIVDLCEEHTGQRDGLTFPIAGINMLKGAATVGFNLSPSEFSPTQIGMMHHVFISAYARLYRLQGPFAQHREPSYSPRQRELVRLLALGHNLPAVAEIMNCSVATARHHLEEAKRKVGARTNAQLIARSIDKNVVLR